MDDRHSTLSKLRECATPLEKYLYLEATRDKDTDLYYSLLENSDELLPYVYTPTVGEACQKLATSFFSQKTPR